MEGDTDHVQDLDVGAIGQRPVGDVGLPAFVRLIGLEPDEGASRTFLRLRGDEASGKEVFMSTTSHPQAVLAEC